MTASKKKSLSDTLTPRAKLSEGQLHNLVGYQLAQAAIITNDSYYQSAGTPLGISKVEFTLLQLIGTNSQVTTSRLARALSVSLPAITMWMSKLEKRGFVIRQRSTTDLRAQYFMLTLEGQTLINQALAQVLTSEAHILSHLSSAETAMLLELLRKVARSAPPKHKSNA